MKATTASQGGIVYPYLMNKIMLCLCLCYCTLLGAQKIQYVTADNGLLLRTAPDRQSQRIGKLPYGTKVAIVDQTGIQLNVEDNGNLIRGQWVKITEWGTRNTGFVFNGYLTDSELQKRTEIVFPEFSLEMELEVFEYPPLPKAFSGDTAEVSVALGDLPEGKRIKLKYPQGSNIKKVALFQRHENSLTIMNDGPHCDLTEWKHYYSEWEKVPYNSDENVFTTTTYGGDAWNHFISVNIDDIKKAVADHCGPRWSNLISDIESDQSFDGPIGVSISRIFLKVQLTDNEGNISEKMVVFKIPMGC